MEPVLSRRRGTTEKRLLENNEATFLKTSLNLYRPISLMVFAPVLSTIFIRAFLYIHAFKLEE